MMKFNFRREKNTEFKHIAHGLIPSASIAPKAAVPRTPPPQSPDPSPERHRSALAAAILSSSLTGQTWAIPPARPRSFSETDRSESFISEPNLRDRWSHDLAGRPHLSSPDHSEGELEDGEEDVDNQDDMEEHVYQTLDRQEDFRVSKTSCDLPLEAKSSTPPAAQMSGRRVPSPDLTEESSGPSPETTGKREPLRKSPENQKEDMRALPPIPTTNRPSSAKMPKQPIHSSPEPNKLYSELQKQKKTKTTHEENQLEKRLQRLEREISHSQASSNLRSSAGSQAELQSLRQQAQELVDENDALKLTVHRLNVELSCYQARFRPLSEQEGFSCDHLWLFASSVAVVSSSKIKGIPSTGSPPWLLDMKYLCPLLLAYEDNMNEKEALLQTTEEEVTKLRAQVDEVMKENERLHDKITKMGVVSQKDCQLIQQQAFVVLQENQVLIDQLEAQYEKAKASHSRHQSEVSKMSKQLMMLEEEKERLQEDLEESRRELQKQMKEVQLQQARLKDVVTWDEHCSIAGKLTRQLEEQESRNKSEKEQLLLKMSGLQEENRSLALDKARLTADVKTVKTELENCKQANRKAERRISTLKRQKEENLLKEEKARHYLEAVISVADHISRERDLLLHMASGLQQEKQGFVGRILNGTVRFSKLQDELKVYRRQASTRLAALEEAVEGRTASHQREIFHLQKLLRERQEAEEKLLQSKREVVEELEVVWQAATRENQHMRKTLLDTKLSGDLSGWALSAAVSPDFPAQASEDTAQSSQLQHKHEVDFYS
ncbi:centrosomal protein of 89 kDa isoform X2 [Girardinichthys multiradiatus]|uniref:centrosomal protein of 89 kDa isoform X2 n=1 Tax=Girardinichthys multiradiatus TaxID=208333 RepID=UPI001FAD6455|nr:centrosomal protein of 89 kDa isoform X2 [Girardinichthys multiradiatus]